MFAKLSSFVDKKISITIVCIVITLSLSSCYLSLADVPLKQRLSPLTQTPQPSSSTSAPRQPFEYISPLPNAQYVSKNDAIILRYGPILNSSEISGLTVSLQAGLSGYHGGTLILADDNRTLIYKPDQPFTPGEQVQVQIGSLKLSSGENYQPFAYSFTIATNQQMGEVASTAVPTTTLQSAFPDLLTLPQDIPHYTVAISSTAIDQEGYIFTAPFYWDKSTLGSYLLILDSTGQIVYYQSVADQLSAFDFKVLPGGYLTYYDLKDSLHVVMDSHYQVIGTYPSGNGYTADLHDFILGTDGYAFMMAYDTESIDMSNLVPGGNPDAAVTGLILQEIDPDQNVIFEWRSWITLRLPISSSLTAQQIDLVHGNGMALTKDGYLLLSSRNLSEVTKISLQTGDIVWRLGGKNSTFQFVNDAGFAFQHNISILPSGDIALFDNHGTDKAPAPSRALEYRLDETNQTATLVWQYTHDPPIFTDFMGSTQRLPNGNTFIGWGNAFTTQEYVFGSITEVTPDYQVVFELTFDAPYVSYRSFRAPWVGFPRTKPTLAFKDNVDGLTLGYSWNGATEVTTWMLYGGSSAQDLSLVDQVAKAGFETQSRLTGFPMGECYFQVAAEDKNGTELSRSDIVSTNAIYCPLGQ